MRDVTTWLQKYTDNSSTFTSIETNEALRTVLKLDLEIENVNDMQDPILERT